MSLILEEARQLQEEIRRHRRFLHAHAEIDLDLPETSAYVRGQLEAMGCEPTSCGRSGLVATIGGGGKGGDGDGDVGKVILLRADMDALPVVEESGLEFRSENGRAHACGHDLHTAMLLGAARLLKRHESELGGTVKLMFQPGEETAHGAESMIEAGVLENPRVDAAIMLHVFSGIPLATGTFIVPQDRYIAPACDTFEIVIQGKGGHGAMPSLSVDPLNIAAHTHIALQAINSREVGASEPVVLTVGYMRGGAAHNVIPDTAVLGGSVRTFGPGDRDFVQKRLEEIATAQARCFRGEATIAYRRGSPAFASDQALSKEVHGSLAKILGGRSVLTGIPGPRMMGSEDFAFIAEKVPSTMMALAAGDARAGYTFPQHHPKIRFDEEALHIGAAAYAGAAMEWLKTRNGVTDD